MKKREKNRKFSSLLVRTQRMEDSIQKLREELEISVEREHREMMLRQQFQYAELQNQINPHFLYNTLETIRGQAILDDNYIIADMTETLAKYFRYNISKNKNDVTLQQELDNIQNYIKIQQYRFQDRFFFRIHPHAEYEEYSNCLIPKMTLQPIVENAIFHGIEQKIEKGSIDIHISTTRENLSVIVEDDGVGMEEETLQTLRKNLEKTDEELNIPESARGSGIAMRNVHQRLKMLYGDMYGLSISSVQNMGTTVELTFPRMVREQEKEC